MGPDTFLDVRRIPLFGGLEDVIEGDCIVCLSGS